MPETTVAERRAVTQAKPRYSRVERKLWNELWFRQLRGPNPNPQSLYVRLTTAPELRSLPILFHAWDVGLARALRWPPNEFTQAFEELVAVGKVKADWENGVVYLLGLLEGNEPANPNVVTHWRKDFSEIPECALRDEAEAEIVEFLKKKGDAWLQAWTQETLPERVPETLSERVRENKNSCRSPDQRSSSTLLPPDQTPSGSESEGSESADDLDPLPPVSTYPQEVKITLQRFALRTGRQILEKEEKTFRKYLGERLKSVQIDHWAAELRKRVNRLMSPECPRWIWKIAEKPGSDIQVWIITHQWDELAAPPSKFRKHSAVTDTKTESKPREQAVDRKNNYVGGRYIPKE